MPEITIDEMIKAVEDLIQTQRKARHEPEMTVAISKTLKEAKQREGKCRWTFYESLEGEGYWNTDCGNGSYFDYPDAHKYHKYCSYCSKEIEWVEGECARRLRKCTKSGVVRIDM